MLTPDYLLRITEGAELIAEELHQYIIKKIVERIMIRVDRGDDYLLTPVDKWQMEVLQEAGYLYEEIQKEIVKKTKIQEKEIQEAMEEAAVRNLEWDDEIYRNAGLSPMPLMQSPYLTRLMQRNYDATLGEWKNFTRSMADEAQQTFIRELDKAYHLVSSGAVSYSQAYLEAIDSIANTGVTVNYTRTNEKGEKYIYHSDTIETATLRALRTGISQMAGQITDARMEEMKWDIILVSAHLGARYGDEGENFTNHFWWQGKFYSKSGEDKRFLPYSVCGEGNAQGIHGPNCRHSHGPGDGENNPFEKFDSQENKEMYDKQQKQRAMERRIRKDKREVMAWKTAVDCAESEKMKFECDLVYQRKSALLKKHNQQYEQYCSANDLKMMRERLQIAKWNRKQAAAARGAVKRYENART